MAVLAGVGAGAMAAIKPPYALVVIALTPYLMRRIGLLALVGAIEFYAAAAVGLAYVALVARFFPQYVADILPLGLAVYAPVREPFRELLSEPGVLLILVLGAALVRIAARRLGEPLVAVPALAALGALAAYLVQGKGWLYQAYPALAFMILAAGFALDLHPPAPRRIALGALTGVVAAFLLLWLGRWPLPIAFAAAIGASAFSLAVEPSGRTGQALGGDRRSRKWASPPRSASPADCSPWTACARRLSLARSRAWARIRRWLRFPKASPSVTPWCAPSAASGFKGFPACGSLRPFAARSTSIPGDEALAARLRPYIDRDRQMLVEDIGRNRPDAILVGKLGTRFHQWAWSDPAIAAARADYQFFAAEPDKDFPAELYARKDLIGLRATLPGVAEGGADETRAPGRSP